MHSGDARSASWMGLLLMVSWAGCSEYDVSLLELHGLPAAQPGVGGTAATDSGTTGSGDGTDAGAVGSPDAGPEAATDAMDAGPDAATNAGPDAATDAGPDAATDAGPDAAADAGPDAAADAGPDAAAGAGPDAATDAGCDHPTACGLGYTPSNFDAEPVFFDGAPSTTLDCEATTTINTSGSVSITGWCGTMPLPVIRSQADGPDLVILPLQGLSIAAGTTLRVVGARPLVLAVRGAVAIDGTLDANASSSTPGAGGNWSCAASEGAAGTGQCAYSTGGSGAGGGGFGTAGGQGGNANTDWFPWPAEVAGGSGGSTRGTTTLSPLLGGCAGGAGGGDASVPAGGAGGGAIQISASGSLTVSGAVRANGGNGQPGCGLTGNGEGGGSGGGSGGAILLEAPSIDTSGFTIEVSGGDGGDGKCACLPPPGGNGSSRDADPGEGGAGSMGGGGGGGGGLGRILLSTVP